MAREQRDKKAAAVAHEAEADAAALADAQAIDETLSLIRESRFLRDHPHRVADEGAGIAK